MKKLLYVVSIVLITLTIALVFENQQLRERNARLVQAVRQVVHMNCEHIPEYVEPGWAVKEIQVRRLTK